MEELPAYRGNEIALYRSGRLDKHRIRPVDPELVRYVFPGRGLGPDQPTTLESFCL